MSHSRFPHTVWVGNIPFGADENSLKTALSAVGTVVSLKIRHDKEGRHFKGYAFCEYETSDSCNLAVKHLNGTVFQGRALRIDYCSNEQMKQNQVEYDSSASRLRALETSSLSSRLVHEKSLSAAAAADINSSALISDCVTKGFVADGKDQMAPKAQICHITQSLTAAQMFYIIGHMQLLIIKAPLLAESLLRDNPALCYALAHAMLLCHCIQEPFPGLEDPEVIDRIYGDQRRKRLLEMKKFYESHSVNKAKAAEHLELLNCLQDSQDPSEKSSAAGKETQDPFSCESSNTKPGSPTVANQASFPTIDPDIIDRIAANPDMVAQLSQLTSNDEASLSESERIELRAILNELRKRGIIL